MTVWCECRYCGKIWAEKDVSRLGELVDLTCYRCGDSNIKLKKDDGETDAFGYNGIRKEDAYIKRKDS